MSQKKTFLLIRWFNMTARVSITSHTRQSHDF